MKSRQGDRETGRQGERKQRRFLVSLSPGLLVFLSILVVSLFFLTIATADDSDAQKERRAIAELVKRGAVVKRFNQQATGIEGLLVRLGDDYGVDQRIIRKDGTVDADVVALLNDLDDLTVEIRGTTLSDDGLESLCALSHLRGLDISGSKISDEGIDSLNDLRQLVLLDLSLTNITDEGLAKLKPTKSLGTLSLQGTRVTERSLPHLLKFAGLKSVFLPSGFTAKSAEAFAERLLECRVTIQ